ncbi:flagellar export chaperone FlgN [Candidatus Enterovibrio altilux]|uniref:Flagellar biosynthesis protein FlgN n=1 Tax=Candidatus Enterovibrio altilux TaxID=1927128 RepID=A0A291B750_9GAMM|nr:flagellar export chaperone FlgN [Candidatus Enterovibrio luxaltus]ATF08817.1 Flagellar biosynthesis protein FlgN [Candidatus Enterovibrio luxaltus]
MSDESFTFEHQLFAQKHDINALIETLKNEITAILSRKSIAIDACTKKKLALINTIQQRDKYLSQCPEITSPSEHNKTLINTIQTMLEQCYQLNDTNGSALQRAYLSMHKLSNIFQEAGGKNEITYDRGGKASGSRTLGTNVKA